MNNAGGPPPVSGAIGTVRISSRHWSANMLAPIALMSALMPKMAARGWGRVVNITSQSVKAPIPQLGLSNAARAGLTGYASQSAPEPI
ncbi:SDR family NAD(P)-dependent oxidoreductase [Falsirhodobacter sp. alg1]|uniref:SDR family NAD(P)-dependent oxidoreductase n=1 Tax=Falsirhodobacter sp. alg1 TaxID=1472418 RepID=UPI001EDBC3A9|nr:SDR family NAD(P)-dependent oxidoreductase [Falsirhodobacter sp. alg1]